MSQSEPLNYRNTLASEIKAIPKEDRPRALDQAKSTSEYWVARSEYQQLGQDEELINDGLGVSIDRKTLYFGTDMKDIKQLRAAEETTVGAGVYLTSQTNAAINYARERSKNGKEPYIYEVGVENMKLLDLRNDTNVQKILPGFRSLVSQRLSEFTSQDAWFVSQGRRNILKVIDSGKVRAGMIKLIAHGDPELFTEYVRSLGYDGLITMEGGEGADKEDHDTYLIFDSERTNIKQKHKII